MNTAFHNFSNTANALRRTVLRGVVLAGLGLGLSLGHLSVQAQTVAADTFIKGIADDLLKTVEADAAVQKGDAKRINAIVDEKIMPNVNFAKMTAASVGAAWRTATPDQQAALQKEFRMLLQRNYGTALAAAKGATLQMRPLRAAADDTEAVVRTTITPPKGEAIQVDYRVEKAGTTWKIYDVNIVGVWMAQNYKTSFAPEIDKNGVAGLIKSLAEKNAR